MSRLTRAKETFTRYDTAEYLVDDAHAAAYIEACLEEAGDDPRFIATALGNVARARGMAQLAKETGITREGLYKALSADGNPSLGTVLKVIGALGLRLSAKPVERRARARATGRKARRSRTARAPR